MSTLRKVRALHKKMDRQREIHNSLLKNTGTAWSYWNALAINIEANASGALKFVRGQVSGWKKPIHWLFGKVFAPQVAALKRQLISIRVSALAGQGFSGTAQEFADKLGDITAEETMEGIRILRESGVLKVTDLPKQENKQAGGSDGNSAAV